VGALELEGELGLGLRLIDVDGNSAQFDEDLNLDRGLFLRDLVLTGRRVGSGTEAPDLFTVHALGIGTRSSTVSATTSFAGIDAFGRYNRTHFTGTTDSDIHSFDFEREEGLLSLARERRSGTVRRAGIDFNLGRRDGFVLSSRSVGFGFVPDVPVNQENRRLGGTGTLGLALGPYDLDLEAGLEDSETQDRRSFRAPHPVFPQSEVTEDFAADIDGLSRRGAVRLRRSDVATNLDADAGFAWRSMSADGTSNAAETGIFNDPDLPFASTTLGELDMEGHGLTIDGGLLWKLSDDVDVDLRFTHEHDTDEGDLTETVTLDEFSGDPPSVSTFIDDLHHESTLDLLEGGVAMPINEWADIDLGLEVGKEHIDVRDLSDDVVVRRFSGSVDQFGGQATLVADTSAASTLEIGGGYGVHPTETSRIGVLFTFDDTRTSFVSLAWHWHGDEAAAAGATARHEQRSSDAFESEGQVDSLSVSGSMRVRHDLTVDGSLSYRVFDYQADTTFVFASPAPNEFPGHVSFESAQNVLTAGTVWDASELLHPRLWLSVSIGTGDASFDYGAIDLDVPYRVSTRLEVGTNASWVYFDGEEQLTGRDYDAGILVLYARIVF